MFSASDGGETAANSGAAGDGPATAAAGTSWTTGAEGGEDKDILQAGTRVKTLAALPGARGSTRRAMTRNQSAQRQRGVSCFRNSHCTSKTNTTRAPACAERRTRASKKSAALMAFYSG